MRGRRSNSFVNFTRKIQRNNVPSGHRRCAAWTGPFLPPNVSPNPALLRKRQLHCSISLQQDPDTHRPSLPNFSEIYGVLLHGAKRYKEVCAANRRSGRDSTRANCACKRPRHTRLTSRSSFNNMAVLRRTFRARREIFRGGCSSKALTHLAEFPWNHGINFERDRSTMTACNAKDETVRILYDRAVAEKPVRISRKFSAM